MLCMLLSRLGWKEYENKPYGTECFTSVRIHLPLRMATQKDSNSECASQEQCKYCVNWAGMKSYIRQSNHEARVIKKKESSSSYCSGVVAWVWKVTDAACWPSMSNDINVMMSKDKTHEEVQAKQQKVAVNIDKTPKRPWNKTGMELLTPSYFVNDYSDFWELDR